MVLFYRTVFFKVSQDFIGTGFCFGMHYPTWFGPLFSYVDFNIWIIVAGVFFIFLFYFIPFTALLFFFFPQVTIRASFSGGSTMCPSTPGKSYVNLIPMSAETVKPTTHKSNSNIGKMKTTQSNKNRTSLHNTELRGLKWVLNLHVRKANLFCVFCVHKGSSLSTDLSLECTNASSVKMKLQNHTAITPFHWNVLYASIGRAVRKLSDDIGWGKDRGVFKFEPKVCQDICCSRVSIQRHYTCVSYLIKVSHQLLKTTIKQGE